MPNASKCHGWRLQIEDQVHPGTMLPTMGPSLQVPFQRTFDYGLVSIYEQSMMCSVKAIQKSS